MSVDWSLKGGIRRANIREQRAMRLFVLVLLQVLQVLVFLPLTATAAGPGSITHSEEDNNKVRLNETLKAEVMKTYGRLPLYFIENNGQVDSRVSFYERGAGHTTFFTKDGLVLALTRAAASAQKTRQCEKAIMNPKDEKVTTEAVTLSFVGANDKAAISASDPMPGHVNYFVGNDESRWRSGIPTYGALTYKEVYKNIDIKFYGNNRRLEHDVIVRPGADPSLVRFAYMGVKGLKVTAKGDLEVSLDHGKIIEQKPVLYQEIEGRRVAVAGSYKLLGKKDGAFVYGFDVAAYDHEKDLVIDPVLVYSTYLGGVYDELGLAIAVDNAGAAYVTGWTNSPDFPLNTPIQGSAAGYSDVFVTKIDAGGLAFVYSTYIGGSGPDVGHAIAVDSTGAAYVTGSSGSMDFPLVKPMQGSNAGPEDVFVAKIDASGLSLVYSTYLGGSNTDIGSGIDVDSAGAAYVTGYTYSSDFPLMHPIQGAHTVADSEVFVTKIDPAGLTMAYSTYITGSAAEVGTGIAVDSTGAAYVTGWTNSWDFPVVNPIQSMGAGSFDAFVTKIDSAGRAFAYSTYIGGTFNDLAHGIDVDSSGAVYVAGQTASTDFPVVNPLQGSNAGGSEDAFVFKLDPTGQAFIYSTYFGGSSLDAAYGIAVDGHGAVYLVGETGSADFPLVKPVQGVSTRLPDVFITKIAPSGLAIDYSTYLGGGDMETGYGIDIDSIGAAYVTGDTYSSDFFLVNPIQGTLGGAGSPDAFVAKISGTLPVVTLAVTPDAAGVFQGSVLGYTVTATNTTALRQCFNYWENVTLPDGTLFPPTGSLMKPIRLCLVGGASKAIHLAHGIPLGAVPGAYIFNSYCGAYTRPTPIIVDEAHFSFDVTVLGPLKTRPETTWRLIENGFAR